MAKTRMGAGRGVTRARIAVAGLALASLAGCTEELTGRSRTVHLESASATYTESRPDGATWDRGRSPGPEVEAKVLVDGRAYGRCKKRWFAFEVACALDVDVELGPDSRLELVLEDNDGATSERMGAATLEHAIAAIPRRGKATLTLATDGSVTWSSVSLDAKWAPRVTKDAARVLDVLAGVLLALGLYGVLRRRFLTADEHFLRSVAFVSAAISALIAWVMMVPVLEHAFTLEPLVVAAPMGLGAYALTAVLIDAIAIGRFGRRRLQVAFAAFGALIAIPLVMAIALISSKVLLVFVVVIGLSLFV